MFQLLSYSVATELQAGLLIYAAGEDEERSYRVMHLGRQLHVATLDLTGSPEDILAQVGDLAARVRALRAAASAHRAA